MSIFGDEGAVYSSAAPATNPALTFNTSAESNNRVNVPNNAALNTLSALTLECYFRPENTPTLADRILDKQGAANKGYNIIFNTSRFIQLAVGNGSAQAGPTGNLALTVGTWYHIAMTWDGSNVKLWIDGTQNGSSSALSGGNTGDDALAFNMGNRPAFDRGLVGTLQEVRLSNIARYTGSFTRPSSRFTTDANTIGLWHLDEGTGTSVTDSSANGLTGTLAGTSVPTWVTDGYLA